MRVIHCILLIVATLLTSHATDTKHKIYCHWDLESYNRTSSSFFNLFHVETRLCSHLVIGTGASLDLNDTGELRVVNEKLLVDAEILHNLADLNHGNTQTILSLGGWKNHAKSFSDMASDDDKREKFYISLIKFLYKWEFKGVLIDWEFPMRQDRKNFVILLKELQLVLQEYSFMLMVVVSGRLNKRTLSTYDIPQIAQHVDYIILNIHHPRDPYSHRFGYNAPLHGNESRRSVERSVQHWLELSKTPKKLLLGLPLFVHTYTLDDLEITAAGNKSKGPGRQHEYSNRPGFMTYGEFCVQESTWVKRFDDIARVPYAFKGDQWASYENGRSLSEKLHFVMDQGLGGVMAWSIDADDFKGKCGEPSGLLKVITSVFGYPSTFPTEVPTTEGHGLCPVDGFFRQPWDCKLYYECRAGVRTDYECPPGDFFDENLGQCKPSKQVKCDQNFVTWRPGDDTYSYRDLPLNLKIVED